MKTNDIFLDNLSNLKYRELPKKKITKSLSNPELRNPLETFKELYYVDKINHATIKIFDKEINDKQARYIEIKKNEAQLNAITLDKSISNESVNSLTLENKIKIIHNSPFMANYNINKWLESISTVDTITNGLIGDSDVRNDFNNGE